MPTTTRWALPYPNLAAVADVPADIQALATALDDVAKDDQGLLAARPVSTVGSPGKKGRYYWATDTAQLFRDNGTGWDVVGGDRLGANGIQVRTALNTFTARSITGTAGQVTVTNGDGVAGAPTISLPATITQAETFSGGIAVTGGTFVLGSATWTVGATSADRGMLSLGAPSFATSAGMARVILGKGGASDTHGMIELEGDTGIIRLGIGGTTAPDVSLTRDAAGAVALSGATTGATYHKISNTGGNLYIGRDTSTGGSLATGTTAYSGVINVNSAHSLHLATNGTVRMTFDSSGRTILAKGLAVPFRAVSADTTATDADGFLTVDTSGAVRTLTLPAANAVPAGFVFRVLRVGANALTIQRAGSDTITAANSTGQTSTSATSGEMTECVSNGSNIWYVG